MPKVSVIVPTYNRASMLKEAIQSVLDQTYADYEIIVLDDGSTDNTRGVVNASSDNRIGYVFQQNHGRPNVRNHALSLVRGRYIAFVDSGDVLLPTRLEKQVARLEKEPGFGMVYTSAICTDEQGKLISFVYKATASGWMYRQVAFYGPLATIFPTVMIRADVLSQVGGFDGKMERFEDADMWRRVAKRYPILPMPEPLCIVRTHSDNELARQDPETILKALMYHVHKAFAGDKDESSIFRRRAAAKFYTHYGAAVLGPMNWRGTSRKFLISSIKYWPLQIGAYFFLIATFMNEPTLAFARTALPSLRPLRNKSQN
jgi:glycosyltransferase involved in cell wall biosynthesis